METKNIIFELRTKNGLSQDELAEKMEDRETSLEDSFALYKKGMELLKYCSEKLDTVEKKMQLINEEGELSDF